MQQYTAAICGYGRGREPRGCPSPPEGARRRPAERESQEQAMAGFQKMILAENRKKTFRELGGGSRFPAVIYILIPDTSAGKTPGTTIVFRIRPEIRTIKAPRVRPEPGRVVRDQESGHRRSEGEGGRRGRRGSAKRGCREKAATATRSRNRSSVRSRDQAIFRKLGSQQQHQKQYLGARAEPSKIRVRKRSLGLPCSVFCHDLDIKGAGDGPAEAGARDPRRERAQMIITNKTT